MELFWRHHRLGQLHGWYALQGAGTVKANTSVGNATGTAVTINVGDSGKAGLLAITGTYTQLATGTMNISIGGLTTGTYSELTVSGTASLSGTLSVGIVNGLVLTASNIGTQFTVLSSTGTLSGVFSNTTVTTGSDVFSVTYVGNTVVLTLTSVTGSKNSPTPIPSITATAAVTKPVITSQLSRPVHSPALTSNLRRGGSAVVGKTPKPILVAGIAPARSHTGSELSNPRTWEHYSFISTIADSSSRVPSTIARTSEISSRIALPTAQTHSQNNAIAVRSPLAGWMASPNIRRTPVKIMPVMSPHITR